MSIKQSVKYGVKGAHAAGSKIAKDRARSTVPGRAISDLKSTVRQAQKGINQPVYMRISGVRSLRDVEDADKRGTLSRDEARRRIVSVACRVNVDVKNKDGIPTVPPEIAPYINYKDIRSALDSGRYDYVNKMMQGRGHGMARKSCHVLLPMCRNRILETWKKTSTRA